MRTPPTGTCTWSWRTWPAVLRDEKGEATAETTNGSLLLAVPSDTQADVEAKCLNGNFSSELPLSLESSLRPREIHGKLGTRRCANSSAYRKRRRFAWWCCGQRFRVSRV